MAGVGFVFCAHDPYTGVDLDRCRDPQTGELEPSAERTVRQLDSYTEVSPSGTGVKIWVRARLPGDRNRTGHIEMYDRARFFTFTGQHLPGTPTTIEDRQAQLDDLYRGLFGCVAVVSPTDPELERLHGPSGSLSDKVTGLPAASTTAVGLSPDQEVLRQAMSAENGEKFCDLWEGRWQSHQYPSQSEADAALCSMLAYWTDGDKEQMDRLFRRSALMRPKWDEARGLGTYGERTLCFALSNQL